MGKYSKSKLKNIVKYNLLGLCVPRDYFMAIGKPRVSPLLSLNTMKVRNQPKLRRVYFMVNRFQVT